MNKEEFLQKLQILENKKLTLQSQFLLDIKGGNLQELKKNLKDQLYILQVEIQTLKSQFTVNKLQNSINRKIPMNIIIENFINECLIIDASSRITKKALFEAFTLYCLRRSEPMKLKYQSFCRDFPKYFPVGKVFALRASKNLQGEEKRTQMFSGVTLRLA